MLKKFTHIIFSLLLLVSTVGLTHTRHFCKAQLVSDRHMENETYEHSHDFNGKSYNPAHAQMEKEQCLDDESCDNDACCANETCQDDNCCQDEIQTVKLSLEYIIDNKELLNTTEFELFHSNSFIFNDLLNGSGIVSSYFIADSPTKIKKSPSFLQIFRC